MPLITCNKCGKQYPDKNEKCSFCGMKNLHCTKSEPAPAPKANPIQGAMATSVGVLQAKQAELQAEKERQQEAQRRNIELIEKARKEKERKEHEAAVAKQHAELIEKAQQAKAKKEHEEAVARQHAELIEKARIAKEKKEHEDAVARQHAELLEKARIKKEEHEQEMRREAVKSVVADARAKGNPLNSKGDSQPSFFEKAAQAKEAQGSKAAQVQNNAIHKGPTSDNAVTRKSEEMMQQIKEKQLKNAAGHIVDDMKPKFGK